MEPQASIPISALQHILFCERQCAFIHLEQQWIENYLTAHGRMLHEKVDSEAREKRKDLIIEYSVPLCSEEWGIHGQADAVEFYLEKNGGIRNVIPIEHKRGKAKEQNWDRVQLCAQAMCLEEMLDLSITEGCLFYNAIKRREAVSLTRELRDETIVAVNKIRDLFVSGKTPPARYKKRCLSCSFQDVCRPKSLGRSKSVARYLGQILLEKETGKKNETS